MNDVTRFFLELNEWQTYLFLFVAVTLMSVVSRGQEALEWSGEMKKSAFVNLLYLKFMMYFGGMFFLVLLPLSTAYTAAGLPQIPRDFWDAVPFPVTCLVLLFVYDISLYWIHRALHQTWLWPMHAVHHSDTELHFLSWSRGHAIEQSFIAACMVLSATWVGLSVTDIAGLALIRAFHQYYVHSNIDWDHGPLKMIIASPQYHRWHHVDHPDAYDKNFASIFPFLDKMFGTYYFPGTAKDMPTGFEGTPGNNIISLIVYPFVEWGRMIGQKFSVKPRVEPVKPEILS